MNLSLLWAAWLSSGTRTGCGASVRDVQMFEQVERMCEEAVGIYEEAFGIYEEVVGMCEWMNAGWGGL